MTIVPRETIAAYADLVRRWNAQINLFSAADLALFEDRHFKDGLAVVPHLPEHGDLHVDFGSGGGIPLIPIALALPDRRYVAVEADRRKCAFLRTVCRQMDLEIDVRSARLETLGPLGADIVTARAFAPMSRMVPLLRRHLRIGGRAVLNKGRAWRDEVTEVEPMLQGFELSHHDSPTSSDGRILVLHRVR